MLTVIDEGFRRHIVDTYGISEREFEKLYEEFLGHFDQPLEEYVRRRHLELQREGLRNDAIYRTLLAEVDSRRFTADGLTERRIRRIIYG